MPDQLRPLFPPDEPNISRQSLELASSLLDEETIKVLMLDRARLMQTTAATALILTQTLELSPDTALEVQQALVRSASELAPNYHHYMNQLLGNGALTLAEQPKERLYVQAEVSSDQHLTAVKVDEEVDNPEHGTEIPQEFKEDDLLTFEPGFIFAEHGKPLRRVTKFISDVFGSEFEVLKLSPIETTLVAYQLIDFYMITKVPNSPMNRKAIQKERMEKYFALYGPAVNGNNICKELGISTASFHNGIRTVSKRLAELLTRPKILDIIQKATTTAEHGSEDLFVQVDKLKNDSFTEVDESTDSDQDDTHDKDNIETAVTETSITELSSVKFKEYDKVPANMINFLSGVYPVEFNDRLFYLEPWQASYLSYMLIQELRDQLEVSALPENEQEEKIIRLERWIGIFKDPQDYADLGRARITSGQNIKNGIENSIDKISKSFTKEGLDDLYQQAMGYSRPTASKPTRD